MSRRSDAGPVFTYFIQRGDDGPIKIGRTRNVQKRMKEIAIGCAEPLRLLVALEGNHERRFHKKLAGDRMCGEWFSPTLTVRKEIEAAATTAPNAKIEIPEKKPRTWGSPPPRRDRPSRYVPPRPYSDPRLSAHRLADRIIAETLGTVRRG